ncbi:sensor histidine kinase [Streptomyces endophyticus]|uniref:Histidine kinase n=1 Tax=Streptomyces endophyticus TaxID=714166 RepID=A0ABU6FBL7_9ACTN|nr:histidine kinase [Streptomyces endophyticus]MEB8341328.1 histidine kinase [Streptomyces endophyticus]
MRVRGSWRERSKVERVELQSRITLRFVHWFLFLGWSASPLLFAFRHDPVAYALALALLVVGVLQCVVAHRHVDAALDQYLGRGTVPRRQRIAAAVLVAVGLALVTALFAVDALHGAKGDSMVLLLPLLFVPVPFGFAYVLTTPARTALRRWVAGSAVMGGVFALAGATTGQAIGGAALLAVAGPFSMMTARCSGWNLSVMWESERAREIEARLAVAEERLRFGRDLHDVMGRNLSVVALKSELAVQLARRGRTEDAVAQMTEVQRIAQESQKEVREVVRGYREVDLGVELAGAQGVLSAAGIACTVTGSAAGLPGEVQSALGWVVREATTNVLRHGDAKSCRVELVTRVEEVVLTVENDGAGAGAATGSGSGQGSGLAGLRERLAAVSGELEAGMVRERVFRVVASVPLTPREERVAPGAQREQEQESAR